VLLTLVMVLLSWIATALVDDEWWDPDENEASKDEKEAEEVEKDTEEDDTEEKKEAEKDTEEKKEAEDTEEKKEAEETEKAGEAEEAEEKKAEEAEMKKAEEAEMKKAEEEAEEKKAEEKKAEEKADPDDDWTDWFRARTVGTNSDRSRGAGTGSSSERKKQFKRPTEGPTEGGDCHAQGPCHDGFMDIFDGDYMRGSCVGVSECEGSAPYVLFDMVNGECICACQSAPETCQSLPGYDDFNVYRFVPTLSFFRYFGWIGDYVAGALAVAVIIALCGAARKFYANRVQKPYVGLKVYDSEVDSVEDGNESEEDLEEKL